MLDVELPPGAVFGDDFKVVSHLSRGGMGAVYVVEQISTQKRRALKLMLAARAADPEMRKRFEQEARVGALIPSEHVVDVIAAGIDSKTQIPWLAMELLDGEDLDALAERRGVLAPGEVHEIFAQLCHALAAAHAIPIVHRDLKPGNIFLARPRLADARPVVKVLDFGIAKIVGGAASTTAAIGTPLWMAPEQSQPRASIQPAADVWALGLIAFRLLAGKVYWTSANTTDASPLSVMREVLFEPIVAASVRARELAAGADLPVGFDAWLAKCLARDPSGRFQDAGEAWLALSPILGGARPSLAGSGPLSDLRSSASASPNTHRTGFASTLVATPAVTPPPVNATLDAVGTTLGGVPVKVTRPTRTGERVAIVAGLIVIAIASVIAVLASRHAREAPTIAAAASTPVPAVSAPETPTPSVAAAPSSTVPAPATSTLPPSAPARGAPPPRLPSAPPHGSAHPNDSPQSQPPKPPTAAPFLL